MGPIATLRNAFVKAFLAFSFLAYLFAEIFSINNLLTATTIGTAWGIVAMVTIYFSFKQKEQITDTIITAWTALFRIEKKYFYLLFVSAVLILFPLLLLAIFIPPNNWDSLSYHLPRIEHWIQDQNIYPYPTNLIRQIITPPLSEYVLFNIRILAGNDWFLNILQFMALLGVIVAFTQILQQLKVSYKGQVLGYALLLSLPMVIFQATTTQTDLLSAFFLIAFLLYTLNFIQSNYTNKIDFLLLVFAISLGILTKYTIAIFALPFIFLIICKVLATKKGTWIIWTALIALSLAAIVLAPFLVRNLVSFGSLTGNEYFEASMSNSHISIQYTIANAFKNIADFISIPVNIFNEILLGILNQVHHLLGLSINDEGANWNKMKFIINNHLNEDSAGSFLHFLLIVFSISLIWKLKNRKNLFWICIGLFATFIIYSAIFRYSPWNNRLFLPLIIIWLIVVAYVLHNTIKNSLFVFIISTGLLFVAILPVYFNRAKPIIMDPFYLKRVLSHSPKAADKIKTVFDKNRLDNYFVWTPFLQKQLDTVFSQIPLDKNRIDLTTEFDSHEYMIWLYAQKHYKGDFYIGTSQNIHYKPFPQNFPKADSYTIALSDSVMHWKSIILSK
jgi:hypothetical protein